MMRKSFLSNIIENEESLNKLSKEILIKISNNRINDIKSEIFKTKYKIMKDLNDFKIYEYDNYNDIYFTGKEINNEIIIKKLKENIDIKNFEIIKMSSRSIKTPHILKNN